MHKTMRRSSLPKLRTTTTRVYMRREKATSARAWNVMPSPRMRGTALSPALDRSTGAVLLVADMLGRCRDVVSLGSGGEVPQSGVVESPKEKKVERASISGSHQG